MALTARISKKGDAVIQEMTALTGKNKIEIIEEALVQYRHYERMRMFNEGYKALQSHTRLWQEELEERKVLEGMLSDGFEEEK